MTPEERIIYFESLMDRLDEAAEVLEEALDVFHEAQPLAAELEEYYDGGQWREDFEADEAGRFPDSLKRGVLSEDALFNTLTRNRELRERVSFYEDEE